MKAQPSPLYNRLTVLSGSSGTLMIAFIWGLAEATLFFLIPDIFLGFVALFNWRRGLLSAAYSVAGALVGGAVMYSLADSQPHLINQVLLSIPLINQDMVDSVADAIHSSGVSTLITGPLQGIPYKVYAVQAGEQGLSLFLFLLVSIFARLERILPTTLAAAAAGKIFRKPIYRFTVVVAGGYLLSWLGIYIWYSLQFQ